MKTPASIFRIPLHAVLGMLAFSLWSYGQLCDFMFWYVREAHWLQGAFYAYFVGLLLAAAGLLPGVIDHLAVASSRPRHLSTLHMIVGIVVLVLMTISVALRWDVSKSSSLAMLVGSAAFLALMLCTALGLYLVHGYGIGVSGQSEARVDETPEALMMRRDDERDTRARGV